MECIYISVRECSISHAYREALAGENLKRYFKVHCGDELCMGDRLLLVGDRQFRMSLEPRV